MQPNPDDHPAPRETAAGLQRGEHAAKPSSKLKDEPTPGAEHVEATTPHTGKHKRADTWNQ
jgi:hypothetical protein